MSVKKIDRKDLLQELIDLLYKVPEIDGTHVDDLRVELYPYGVLVYLEESNWGFVIQEDLLLTIISINEEGVREPVHTNLVVKRFGYWMITKQRDGDKLYPVSQYVINNYLNQFIKVRTREIIVKLTGNVQGLRGNYLTLILPEPMVEVALEVLHLTNPNKTYLTHEPQQLISILDKKKARSNELHIEAIARARKTLEAANRNIEKSLAALYSERTTTYEY